MAPLSSHQRNMANLIDGQICIPLWANLLQVLRPFNRQYHLQWTKDETRQHWMSFNSCRPFCHLTPRYFQIFLIILVTALVVVLRNWVKHHRKFKLNCSKNNFATNLNSLIKHKHFQTYLWPWQWLLIRRMLTTTFKGRKCHWCWILLHIKCDYYYAQTREM